MNFFDGPGVFSADVYRKPPPDKFGDAKQYLSHSIPQCFVAWTDSNDEIAEPAETSTTRATLYAPFDTDINNRDLVELPDGTRWRVTGVPFRWVNPFTGEKPGIEVRIKYESNRSETGLKR